MSKQILRRTAPSCNRVFYLPVSMQNLYSMAPKFIHLFRTPQRNQNDSLAFFCPSPNEIWVNNMCLVSQKISTGWSYGAGYISEKQVSSLQKQLIFETLRTAQINWSALSFFSTLGFLILGNIHLYPTL